MSSPATPACPYCGEHQAYDEARPSKPRVVVSGGVRSTKYDTECRACGERIMWGMQWGSGRLSEFGHGQKHYSWSKPSVSFLRAETETGR